MSQHLLAQLPLERPLRQLRTRPAAMATEHRVGVHFGGAMGVQCANSGSLIDTPSTAAVTPQVLEPIGREVTTVPFDHQFAFGRSSFDVGWRVHLHARSGRQLQEFDHM